MPRVNNQSWNADGVLVKDEWVDVPYQSLCGHQIIAALNAALGVWTLQDAANAAGVDAEHLVAEVQAWAVASSQR